MCVRVHVWIVHTSECPFVQCCQNIYFQRLLLKEWQGRETRRPLPSLLRASEPSRPFIPVKPSLLKLH